ncbi:unnamed protein product [Ixodes persulcatus]
MSGSTVCLMKSTLFFLHRDNEQVCQQYVAKFFIAVGKLKINSATETMILFTFVHKNLHNVREKQRALRTLQL